MLNSLTKVDGIGGTKGPVPLFGNSLRPPDELHSNAQATYLWPYNGKRLDLAASERAGCHSKGVQFADIEPVTDREYELRYVVPPERVRRAIRPCGKHAPVPRGGRALSAAPESKPG